MQTNLEDLSVYEQLYRKKTPVKFGCSKKLKSICVIKNLWVLLLKLPITQKILVKCLNIGKASKNLGVNV